MNRQLLFEVLAGEVIQFPDRKKEREQEERHEQRRLKDKSDPMAQLAKEAGLEWDGGDDERLFDEMIHVDVSSMTEEEYDEMEEALGDFDIKRDGYSVYASNDSSGYDYWKDEG